MANPFEEYTFFQTVNLRKPHAAIRKLLFKIRHYGEDHLCRDLIPTFIQVKISEILPKNDVPVMRQFCQLLRDVQSQNFVRFGMSLNWAGDTSNVDMFYTTHKDTPRHKDVEFYVKVLNSEEVEVKVTVPFGNRQSTLIRELSRQMTLVYPAPDDTHDDNQAAEMLQAIMADVHINEVIDELKEPCYIFFILNRDRTTYIPIPLYGINFADAQRKRYVSEQNLDYLDKALTLLTPVAVTRMEAMKHLVALIQDNEEGSTRSQAAMDSYRLAELLFSYLLDPANDKIPITGAYLFDLYEDGPDDFDMEIMSVTKTPHSL